MVVSVAAGFLATSCTPPQEWPSTTTTTTPADDGPTGEVGLGVRNIVVGASDGDSVNVSVVDPSTLPATPPGKLLTFGALSIEVSGVAIGSVVTLTVTLPDPVEGLIKLIDGEWDDFADDGTTGATLSADGRTITLRVRDGGRGDTGSADGEISDPLAPTQSFDEGCYPATLNWAHLPWLGDPDGVLRYSRWDIEVVGPIDTVDNVVMWNSDLYLSPPDTSCIDHASPATVVHVPGVPYSGDPPQTLEELMSWVDLVNTTLPEEARAKCRTLGYGPDVVAHGLFRLPSPPWPEEGPPEPGPPGVSFGSYLPVGSFVCDEP